MEERLYKEIRKKFGLPSCFEIVLIGKDNAVNPEFLQHSCKYVFGSFTERNNHIFSHNLFENVLREIGHYFWNHFLSIFKNDMENTALMNKECRFFDHVSIHRFQKEDVFFGNYDKYSLELKKHRENYHFHDVNHSFESVQYMPVDNLENLYSLHGKIWIYAKFETLDAGTFVKYGMLTDQCSINLV